MLLFSFLFLWLWKKIKSMLPSTKIQNVVFKDGRPKVKLFKKKFEID
jgi:hypothetical protein